jgi:PTH1 family peptidyl-tRNA hydrolase
MKLIAGLGNVGTHYRHTRHNIGFMIADELALSMDTTWQSVTRLDASIALTEQDGVKIVLAKPHTMMNLSGQSLRKIMQFYRIATEDVWLIFDDVDIPYGKMRLRLSGTSGGHQGVSSAIQHAGPNFVRARIGISLNDRAKEPSEIYVLKPFTPEEKTRLPELITSAAGIIREQLSADPPEETTFNLVSE